MNKRELSHLVIGTFLIVVFFLVFTSILDGVQASDTFAKWHKMDLYSEHHGSGSLYSERVYLPIIVR